MLLGLTAVPKAVSEQGVNHHREYNGPCIFLLRLNLPTALPKVCIPALALCNRNFRIPQWYNRCLIQQ